MTREGYLAGTSMEGGYPSEADILDYLHERGLEILTENNPNFITEFLKYLWGLVNALEWTLAIGVYCPTTTTINIRGGKYIFDGTVKTYTSGSNINPTDNDTTYVWMKGDNTVGYGIDGNGWPEYDHIKLAEVDVNSGGSITDIRDLRGQSFMSYLGSLTTANVVCKDGQVVCKDNEVVTK